METNVLAKRLATWIKSVKPYSSYLVGGVVVLLGLVLVNSLWGSRSASKDAAAWDAFVLAINSSDREMQGLQRLAADDEYAGTKMQEWAYVTWADRQVFLAADNFFINRERTKELLKPVLGVYETLAKGATDRTVQDRARFGLARVYELRNELDEARKQYALVNGGFSLLAAEQIEKLEKPEVQADCLWLAETKLPPRIPAAGPGSPGMRPDFEASLPSTTEGQPMLDKRTLEQMLEEFEKASEEGRYDETDATETDATETEPSEEGEAVEDDSPAEEASVEVEEASAEEASVEEASVEEPSTEDSSAP